MSSCMTESNPTGRLSFFGLRLVDTIPHYKQYFGVTEAHDIPVMLKIRLKSVCQFKYSTFTKVLQSQDHS